MKFLADENIPLDVINFLKSRNIDVVTLSDLGKSRLLDKEIADIAQKENRIILTLDLDFGYIYYFEKRNLINIVIFRANPSTPEKIIELLTNLLNSNAKIEGLVMITKNKIRVSK
jgi:predicted nuclease of predicted toxin-antitoxin system